MTNPVAPPAAPTVPEFPALGDPSFNSKAYIFGSGMSSVVSGIDALAENAFTNATSANEDAEAAQASALTAQTAASQTVAVQSFKGAWSGLSGALAVPASVSHVGLIWMLTESVANVATEEPGISSKWVPVNSSLPFYSALVNSGGVYDMTVDGHYDFSVNAPSGTAAIARAPATAGEGTVRVITRATYSPGIECRRVQFDPNGKTVEHEPSDLIELDQLGTYVWRYMCGTWRLL